MLNSSRLFGLIKYTAAFLLLLLLAGPYLRDQSERVREQYLHVERPPTPEDEKHLFVSRFLAGDVGGPIKGTEIAALCAKRPWLPDDKAVIVSCDPVAGGMGHVKNGQLNCIRFAIEIGGEERCSPFSALLFFFFFLFVSSRILCGGRAAYTTFDHV